MKRTNLAIVVGVSTLALAGVLASCGGGGDEATTAGRGGKVLVIGDSLPLSGGLSSLGPAGEKAAGMALDQIDKAIATAGLQQTVKLENADNASSPDGSVQAARDLADEDASCIAGPWGSENTIATARAVSIPQRILEISPAASADEIATLRDRGLLNRTVLPDRDQGPAIANAIGFGLRGAEGKTVNIGARKDVYGAGIADSFTQRWESFGGSIGKRVEYQPGLPNYDSQAQQITSGNPDSVLIVDRSDNFPALGRALAATGNWDPKNAWGTDGLVSDELLKNPGSDAVGGMRVTAPGTPSDAPSTAFDKLYRSSAPTDVGRHTFDAQNFDAVMLCYLASVAAGSTNGQKMAAALQDVSGSGGKKYTWQQLPQAIDALQSGEGIDYVGAAGDLNLNANGDPTGGAYDLYTFGKQLAKAGAIPVTGAR